MTGIADKAAFGGLADDLWKLWATGGTWSPYLMSDELWERTRHIADKAAAVERICVLLRCRLNEMAMQPYGFVSDTEAKMAVAARYFEYGALHARLRKEELERGERLPSSDVTEDFERDLFFGKLPL